jgi:uncharacterized protein
VANRFSDWAKSLLPTRESLASNRWTKPFARHILRPDLWLFNRRSVPRAVAIGLLIAPIVPIAHTGVAALAAVPVRANIVVAAAITWLINPFTMPPFYLGAYWIGKTFMKAETTGALGAAEATAIGTVVMSVIWSALGYVIASLGWRWRISRMWRKRPWRAG